MQHMDKDLLEDLSPPTVAMLSLSETCSGRQKTQHMVVVDVTRTFLHTD